MSSTTIQWRRLLDKLLTAGVEACPRNKLTKEILCHTSHIPMLSPVVTCPGRQMGYRFLAAEAAWILSGDNRVSSIAPYAKHIKQFSDDGISYFGAYGPPFVEQASYVADSLYRDPMTRQAVMTIWRQRPRETKDVPCTVALQWVCRDKSLHCIATMRSSDAWLGWVYDVFNFSMMSAYTLLLLRQRDYGTRLVEQMHWRDVELGNLYLTAGSQHLYSIDWERAKECIARNEDDLAFAYRPLDLLEFAAADELVKHLKLLADGGEPKLNAKHKWLQELPT